MQRELMLTIDRPALERCFVVGDIIADLYGRDTEYALVGLAAETRPYHVVATLLLHKQQVNDTTVFQSGRNIYLLKREIDGTSEKLGETLFPVCFVHSHLSNCFLSSTDEDFLTGTWIDCLSAISSFCGSLWISPSDLDCRCLVAESSSRNSGGHSKTKFFEQIEYSLAFSLIVTRQGEYSLHSARKIWCPRCGCPSVRLVPATLKITPQQAPLKAAKRRLRHQLETEVPKKIQLMENCVLGDEPHGSF